MNVTFDKPSACVWSLCVNKHKENAVTKNRLYSNNLDNALSEKDWTKEYLKTTV